MEKAESILISVETLNELLSQKRHKYFVSKTRNRTGIPDDSYGMQGEYNEEYLFYTHPNLPKNIFLREAQRTDSYGEDEYSYEFQFVEGKEKTITVFEPIN